MTGRSYQPINFIDALLANGIFLLFLLASLWGSVVPWIYGETYIAKSVNSRGCVVATRSNIEKEFCDLSVKPGTSFLVDRRTEKVTRRKPKQVGIITLVIVAMVLSLRIRYGSLRNCNGE